MFNNTSTCPSAMMTGKIDAWFTDKYKVAFGVVLTFLLLILGVTASAQSGDAPVSNAGFDRVISVQNELILDGTKSVSPTGDKLSYNWSVFNAPDNSAAQIPNPLSPRPIFTPDLDGEYILQLVVTSASGLQSEPDFVTLSTGNLPPVASAGDDRFTLVGAPLVFDPEGTFDVNGDRLTASWSIVSFPSEEPISTPEAPANNNQVCPANTTESIGTFHVVSAVSVQQNPHLAVGAPLPEGTRETGSNSAITYYGPITMDLTGDASVYVPAGEVIEIVLSSAWGTSARAEILMSADGDTYTSLGTVGNGGSVYGAYTSNILRYDSFTVPAGGARFLQVSHQNSGVRADGVIYSTQCQSDGFDSAPEEEESDQSDLASLLQGEDGRFIFTPNVPGEYSVELVVEDSIGARSTDIIDIYVAPLDGVVDPVALNLPPQANAGLSQITTIGEAIILDGSQSTDVNGDMLSYQWSVLSKPADSFSLIENSSSAIAEIWPDTDRTYILQLEVTDAHGLRDYATVVLDGSFVSPTAVSGGPDALSDGAISNQTASVDASVSQSGSDTGFNLSYDWSVLGLSDGESEIENAASVSTNINFPEGSDNTFEDSETQDAIDLLEEYNLIAFNDVDSGVDIRGRSLIGGNLFGNSATFGTQIPQGQNVDALSVVGNITGGAKNINNGGNVRLGGSVSTHLNLNGGGQLINDAALSVTSEQSSLLALSANLAGLTANSTAEIPSPNGQHGPGRLNASPDESGVAVFEIVDGNLLFSNDRVQQIEVNANGAETIIVNVGGADIDFNRGNFVGAINNDDLRRKIIWNFHEATDIFFERAFHGTLLAPQAHLFNRSDIRGTVVVDSLQARGPLYFPGFSGSGLTLEAEEGTPTEFALVQLAVSDAGNAGLAPAYSSLVLTTGNLRPVARIERSGIESVQPGVEVSFNGGSSSDGNNDPLTYSWSILGKPDGSSVQFENAAASNVSLTPDRSGLYIVQLIVSDGELTSRPVTFAIDASNSTPTANAGPDQVSSKGDLVSLDGTASSDPDGDNITYAWAITTKPDGSEAVLSDASSATPDFQTDLGGDYVISLTVNDGIQNSASDTVTITAVNRVPVAAVTGPSSVFAGDTVMLTSVGSTDADGDVLTYIWSLETPEGSAATLSDATDPMPFYTPDVAGIFTVTLIVEDGEDASAAVSLQTEVDASNRPPELDVIGNKSVSLGSTLAFQISATDPDGDNVFYTVNAQPDGASFEVETGVFSFTPKSLLPESFSVVFGASDGILRDSEIITISINNSAETNTTEYSGQIVDAITGSGVQGVQVVAGSQFATTDANGQFTLTNLEPGPISIWVVGDENTELAANGQPYAPTQIAATLFENVNNQGERPIRLSTVSASGVVTPGEMITVSSSAFGVSLEIPADAILDMTTNAPYSGQLSISAISPEEANNLPPNIVPCQLFSLAPKTIQVSQPVTLTVDNYDNLPAGSFVDVWVFSDGEFSRRGTGTVTADAVSVEAVLTNIPGGAMIALAPRPAALDVSLDQPSGKYIPSLLGEGNYSTALSLPGYKSNGAYRGLSFVYNSTAAAPSPIISSNVTLGSTVPADLDSYIEIGGVNYGLSGQVSTSGSNDALQQGETARQSAQIDASNLPVGLNTYNFVSLSQYACSSVGQVVQGEVFVDNQVDSPFGQGWSLAELSRIFPQNDGSVLIREGNGTLTDFKAQTDFTTLGDPVRLPAVGPFSGDGIDIDFDGDQDIYWLVPEQGGVLFYENLGDENFEFRGLVEIGRIVDVPPSGSFTPDVTQIGFGDFNADGLIDFATGSQLSDDTHVVFAEQTPFNFGTPIKLENRDSRSLVVGDFNGDGIDDFVTFGAGFAIPQLFAGSTTGNLIQSPVSGGSTNQLGTIVADYNGDGILDIIGRGLGRIEGWRGREGQVPIRDFRINGLFAGFLGNFLEVSDVNSDGLNDVLVSSSRDGLQIFAQQADGSFDLIDALIANGVTISSTEFALRDINADGLDDIVIARGRRVITFFNDPDGLFSEADIVDLDVSVGGPRLADFNQDESLDVIVDSQSEDALFVYFSDPQQTSRFVDPLNDYTELTRNEDGSYQRRYKDGTVIAYDTEGLHTSTTDSNGNVTAYTYDAADRVSTITDPVGLVTDFEYNSAGMLNLIRYPDGRTSSWTYDSNGRLVRSEDVNGDITTHAYDPEGRITATTDPRGLTTEVLYGPAGRYAGSNLPDGTELRLELAKTLGLPELGGGEFTPGSATTTSVQDGRGNITETMVNDYGSPIQVTDPLGRVTIYERDSNNNVTAIIAPSSVTPSLTLRTELDYDEFGNVIAKRDAVGTAREREMTYTYEPEFSKMTSMVDYDGFETLMTYDEFGNRLTETDPLGGVITMTYDERGLATSQTDKNGNLTQFTYDNRGLLVTMRDPSNTVMEYSYDDAGNLINQIDDFGGGLSREMSYVYDEKNREISMTAGDGGVTTYVYDGNDNVISTTDPTGIVETRSYDDRDRLETINDPASGTTVFVYDEDSNILRMTDALSETTEFSYDAVDRLLSSIDARGQLRAFAYDRRDNITAVTDARANITHMGYDELDRPTARTNPKGEQWNFAYDARDNRTSATKPDGVVLLSDYDGLSRLTRIAGGDIERTYAYDPQSNLLAANDNLNGVNGPDLGFSYDHENRLETAGVSNLFGNGAQNNRFTYAYDALDRRESMADSFGGNTAYAYDPVDRLTRVTTPQGEVFTTNYDLAGRMLGRAAPNTTVTTRAYEDDTGRLASKTHSASDTAFNGFTYDYTERGNIGEIAETGTIARTKRYSYDELERLTEVEVPDAPTEDESYTLDPEGNRLSSHLSDTGETDVANRLSGDDAYSYVYDLNGNLLTKTAKAGVARPDWAYAYDDLDQLISVSRDGIEVERYRYDAFGRRSVIETANDNAIFERTAIVNDGSDRTIDLVQVTDGAGGTTTQIQNRYTHGGQVDEPLSLETFEADGSFDQAYTYHADHLGSIRFVTDSVGNIVNAYEYDSYGRPGFAVELVVQPFRYTGREWDQATELYHYRARQYDPETGKFLQEDPIGMLIGVEENTRYIYPNPNYDEFLIGLYSAPALSYGPDHNINLYRYVENNPINYIDPAGLFLTGYSATAKNSLNNTHLQIAILASIRRRQIQNLIRRLGTKREVVEKFVEAVDCGLAFASGASGIDLIPTDFESQSDIAGLCNAIGMFVNFVSKTTGGA